MVEKDSRLIGNKTEQINLKTVFNQTVLRILNCFHDLLSLMFWPKNQFDMEKVEMLGKLLDSYSENYITICIVFMLVKSYVSKRVCNKIFEKVSFDY